MSTPFSDESRICRVCGQAYPANTPTCPRCGYTPASSAPDVEGGWKQRIPLPPRPKISRVAVAVLAVGLVLPLTAALLIVLSLLDDIESRGGVPNRPEASPGEAGDGGGRACERKMMRYLRDLSESFGESNRTAALFIEASNDFGPASERYRALIDIYGDVNSLVAEGKIREAMRRAKPQIRAACSR